MTLHSPHRERLRSIDAAPELIPRRQQEDPHQVTHTDINPSNAPRSAKTPSSLETRAAGVVIRQPAKAQTDVIIAANGNGRLLEAVANSVSFPQPDLPVGGNVKRAIDLVLASVALLLLLPVIVIAALAIKIADPGPILYRQSRIGFNGLQFDCYKFRTMMLDGEARLKCELEGNPSAALEWKEKQKLTNDPRVTRIGNLLRKSSIDELPQLLNILRGEMSCVGPRPIVASEHARFGVYAKDYQGARPGVTGLWQVSGRSQTTYERRVALDRYYVRRWSLWLDVIVIFRTIPALFKHEQTS